MSVTNKRGSSRRSIFQWFLIRFVCFSLIFVIALIPLLAYGKKIYTDLEIKKSTQHISFGISQIESSVVGVKSAAANLRQDLSFLPFYYSDVDYASIPTTTGMQLKDYLARLMFPLPLTADWVLQFSPDHAVTSHRYISKTDYSSYYYDSLQIDDLSYEQWEEILVENHSGFLGVHKVTYYSNQYNALIYAVPWTSDSFLFACFDVNDIKASLIEKDYRDTFYLTISRNDGTVLYSDLPENEKKLHTVTEKTSTGNLVITVHIPELALGDKLNALYYLIGGYILLFSLVWMVSIYISSRISSRPVMQIIDILDNHNPKSAAPTRNRFNFNDKRHHGFQYIHDELHTYKQNLVEYKNVVETHKSVLQARYLEKTIHGSLVTPSDYDAFYSYFPDFPEEFCLVLVGLHEEEADTGNIYQDALSLIQVLLASELPNVYIQQISHYELLAIVDKTQYHTCSAVINGIIANINQHEPCYHAWGLVSKNCKHPKDISSAFDQLLYLRNSVDPTQLSQLRGISDELISEKTNLQMADILSIHAAITYGNKELALLKLNSYSSSLNRATYEIFRSVLLCIKQDYPELFFDIYIPDYHMRLDLYHSLHEHISAFCEKFQAIKDTGVANSFAHAVKDYIDFHFSEDSLSSTSLADHFQCSSSKISKAFLKEFDITVTSYIEKLRMNLATELLTKGEYSVAEISQKCGYTNINTFYKAYKRVYGHSPAALREK